MIHRGRILAGSTLELTPSPSLPPSPSLSSVDGYQYNYHHGHAATGDSDHWRTRLGRTGEQDWAEQGEGEGKRSDHGKQFWMGGRTDAVDVD